jgi:hypothetical protein
MRPAKLILAFVLPCLMVRPAFGDGGVEPVGARFEEAKPPVSDASAVRIVDLYLAARGETAVRTFMLSGSVKEGLHEYRVTHYFQAPDKYRKEVSRENLGWQHRTVYASDGKIAWKQEQLPELKPAMTLEPDEMAEVEPEHWAYLLLSDWRDKGVVLEYVGEATTAGAPTYIVRANQGGRRVLYHFDQKLFLPRAIKYEDKVAGREVDLDHFPCAGCWWTEYGWRVPTRCAMPTRSLNMWSSTRSK